MGRLVLVVGPSGAGKDTLISKARRALAGDARFRFVRRVITRSAVTDLEDHDTVSDAVFAERAAAGGFALHWEAHGLSYGIPVAIDRDLAAGRVVVANGSRRMIAAARKRYPDCIVLLIEASAAVRAERLAGRGRESATEIAERLGREGGKLPEGIAVTRIDNSGALETALAAFVAALRAAAE